MDAISSSNFCCPKPCAHICIKGPPLLTLGGSGVGELWLQRPLLQKAPWGKDPLEPPAPQSECAYGCIGRRPARAASAFSTDQSTVSTAAPSISASMGSPNFAPPAPLRPKLPDRKEPDHVCSVCRGESGLGTIDFRCLAHRRVPSRPLHSREFLRTPPDETVNWWETTPALRLYPEPPLSPAWARRPYINVVGAVGDAGWLEPHEARECAASFMQTLLDRAFEMAERGSRDSRVESRGDYTDSDDWSDDAAATAVSEPDKAPSVPCPPCARHDKQPRDAREVWQKLTKRV